MAYQVPPLVIDGTTFGPKAFFDGSIGGFIWGVKFMLPFPAKTDGWIIQKIDLTEEYLEASGKRHNRNWLYWEAWQIKKGESGISHEKDKQSLEDLATSQGLTPPATADWQWRVRLNDFFFMMYGSGSIGRRRVHAVAGFYDEPALPTSFVRGNPDTEAGALRASRRKPDFWQNTGLVRDLTFDFNFRTTPEDKILFTSTKFG
jgi:hypothetical protein